MCNGQEDVPSDIVSPAWLDVPLRPFGKSGKASCLESEYTVVHGVVCAGSVSVTLDQCRSQIIQGVGLAVRNWTKLAAGFIVDDAA